MLQHAVESFNASLIIGKVPSVADEFLTQRRNFLVEFFEFGFPTKMDHEDQLPDDLVVVELLKVNHDGSERQGERRGLGAVLPEFVEAEVLDELKHFVVGHDAHAHEDVACDF